MLVITEMIKKLSAHWCIRKMQTIALPVQLGGQQERILECFDFKTPATSEFYKVSIPISENAG